LSHRILKWGKSRMRNLEKLKYMRYIPIILLAGYFGFKMLFPNEKDIQNRCEKEMDTEFYGKIVAKIPDSANPKREYIVLDNNQRILQPYTFGLWILVEVGDSILKKRNTLDYLVSRKRKNYDVDTIHFDPCR